VAYKKKVVLEGFLVRQHRVSMWQRFNSLYLFSQILMV